jgi:hypothetical protein
MPLRIRPIGQQVAVLLANMLLCSPVLAQYVPAEKDYRDAAEALASMGANSTTTIAKRVLQYDPQGRHPDTPRVFRATANWFAQRALRNDRIANNTKNMNEARENGIMARGNWKFASYWNQLAAETIVLQKSGRDFQTMIREVNKQYGGDRFMREGVAIPTN